MFYILNLDHNGRYQGVYEKFDTMEQAKSYLDSKPDTVRMGTIGYREKYLSNIIFESLATDVEYKEMYGYEAEDDDSLFYIDMNKMLKFVSRYKHILSDDI